MRICSFPVKNIHSKLYKLMKKINTLVAALLLGMSAQNVSAQDYSDLDYKPYPYAFVTLQ